MSETVITKELLAHYHNLNKINELLEQIKQQHGTLEQERSAAE